MSSLEIQNIARTQWGIREFAEIFDVTPRTIRFYEDKGLLTPSRGAGGRIFNQDDYQRFEKIMRAKRLGFTLGDIKEVLDVTDGHITDRVELLRRQKNFRHVIASLKRRREDIAYVTRDMIEICNVIDDYAVNGPEGGEVSDLASAYQAKFSQTPFVEETADDYQSIHNGEPAMASTRFK